MSGRVKDPSERDSVGKALRRTANPSHFSSLVRRGVQCYRERGGEALAREISYRVDLMTKGESWRFRADIPLRRELREQQKIIFPHMPLVSVVVPLYNTPERFFKEMVESVRVQSYQNWELVLVDASNDPKSKLGKLAAKYKDGRINYCRLAKNEGIAANTNVGLAEASGEFIALLDHDDVLSSNALYEVVRVINETGADFIYSDEIVLDASLKKLSEYHFKPDFSPDTLRGCNYITHLAVFSRELFQRAGGGERPEFDGAQDYDLILRLTEKANRVEHIPKVLYYWRGHAASTSSDMSAKPYAVAAGAGAVQAHLDRLGLDGKVVPIEGCPGAYRTQYKVCAPARVSVLIPNKDHVDDLKRCLAALYKNAGWKDLEVIVIENNSTDPATMEFYKAAARLPGLRFLKYSGPFNFSAINNAGAQFATGDYLLLLNNDVEIETPGFVQEMLSYAQRPDVGAVGAKLFYPDGTVQHAGVFIGLGGSAGHNHKGHPRDSAGDMYRLATTQNFCAVTGACLMVKKSLYQAVGGLDEKNFAVAYNDVDFCLKLRAKGYLNVMTPFATAVHHESKSRGDDTQCGGERQARYEAEKARFVEKYAALMERGDPYYNPHFTLLYENYGYK
ncbi:glycosyltransferase family 2 protein [uncultured Ruthenibacterium sp.]|uniref:glycosyltransferase family 2 protein n=1 Tax=uncultured Ruthenibacterium sp. TaxID=1905347 RepID=UPI00349E7196